MNLGNIFLRQASSECGLPLSSIKSRCVVNAFLFSRMYSSSPIQALQYIAIISHGKKPGEIVSTDTGVGNDEFNQGVHGCSGPSGYAYEIKGLYELHEPLKLKDMQKRYGVTFPQRFVYVPEKMQEDFVIETLKRIF